MTGLPVLHSNGSSIISDIKARLGKRSTFEAAAAELTTLLLRNARQQRLGEGIGSCEASTKEIWETVSRCSTLLRTRYTAPAFWRVGRFLFQAAAAAAQTAEQRKAAAGYLRAADVHLAEQDPEQQPENAAVASNSSSRATSRPGFLFEGQFSEGSDIPQNPALGTQRLLNMLMAGAEEHSEADGSTSPLDETAGNGEVTTGLQLDQLLQHFRDAFGDANSEELEAALRQSLEDGGGVAPRAPPASQSAVQGLKREELTAARLADLGGAEAECSVCREELAVGSAVQVMPCSDGHVFHVPCLAPWLKDNNSCPVCRHELPTDDDTYERRKVREAEAVEATRGAAAALSHNEFMYM